MLRTVKRSVGFYFILQFGAATQGVARTRNKTTHSNHHDRHDPHHRLESARPPHPPSPVGGGGEDLDDLWLEIDTLGERLEDLTDSVSFLLMLEDRGLPEWPAN